MMLILHILIALSSLIVSGYLLARPSTKTLFTIAYTLIFATISSGTVLAITTPAQTIHVCSSAVVYLIIISILTVGAKRKQQVVSEKFFN